MKNKLKEIIEQFRVIGGGNFAVIDALLPSLVFIIAIRFLQLATALLITLIPAGVLLLLRIFRKQSKLYIAIGAAGLIFAFGSAWISGNAAGYFLPSIVSDAFLSLFCLISIFLKRPLVALTSHITRRWPLAWYWHSKVRPAYSEVTLFWGLYFGLKIIPQWFLYNNGNTQTLGWLNILTGFPGLIILLMFSYLYGLWRLRNLRGPSVEEFIQHAIPPWKGQTSGF